MIDREIVVMRIADLAREADLAQGKLGIHVPDIGEADAMKELKAAGWERDFAKTVKPVLKAIAELQQAMAR